MSIIANIILISAAFFIGSLPAIYAWRRAYCRRRLSEYKAKISKTVLEMEKLMLAGELTHGQICHDKVFRLMSKVQLLQRYPVMWWPTKETEHTLEFKAKLTKELEDQNSPARLHIGNFLNAYFGAFQASRPIVSKFYLGYLIFMGLILRLTYVGLKTFISILSQKDARHKYLIEELAAKTYQKQIEAVV
jgi:hypothetical protein